MVGQLCTEVTCEAPAGDAALFVNPPVGPQPAPKVSAVPPSWEDFSMLPSHPEALRINCSPDTMTADLPPCSPRGSSRACGGWYLPAAAQRVPAAGGLSLPGPTGHTSQFVAKTRVGDFGLGRALWWFASRQAFWQMDCNLQFLSHTAQVWDRLPPHPFPSVVGVFFLATVVSGLRG